MSNSSNLCNKRAALVGEGAARAHARVARRVAQHVVVGEARVGGAREHAARVGARLHAHVAALAPRLRPRVLEDEVRLAPALAPAHRQHRVVQLLGRLRAGSVNILCQLSSSFINQIKSYYYVYKVLSFLYNKRLSFFDFLILIYCIFSNNW